MDSLNEIFNKSEHDFTNTKNYLKQWLLKNEDKNIDIIFECINSNLYISLNSNAFRIKQLIVFLIGIAETFINCINKKYIIKSNWTDVTQKLIKILSEKKDDIPEKYITTINKILLSFDKWKVTIENSSKTWNNLFENQNLNSNIDDNSFFNLTNTNESHSSSTNPKSNSSNRLVNYLYIYMYILTFIFNLSACFYFLFINRPLKTSKAYLSLNISRHLYLYP